MNIAAKILIVCFSMSVLFPGGMVAAASDPNEIETVVLDTIQNGIIPGAVVIIGNHERVLYHRAFGHRSIQPEQTPMTTDAIFDVASLSKAVSTAPCIQLLIDRGLLTLDTKVSAIIPPFAAENKQDVRIVHLLTHTSGLPAYTGADALKKKYGSPCKDQVLEHIYALKPQAGPGEAFRYSCLGYIVLGRIVELVSGQPFDEFARDHLFKPLRMTDTGYNPSGTLQNRLVPTTVVDGHCLLGQVHDPLAALMGGVSGNAGIFSTTADLARYATMLLNHGRAGDHQILSETAMAALTQTRIFGRACGFDVSSAYANIKGARFSPQAFCHSGATPAPPSSSIPKTIST